MFIKWTRKKNYLRKITRDSETYVIKDNKMFVQVNNNIVHRPFTLFIIKKFVCLFLLLFFKFVKKNIRSNTHKTVKLCDFFQTKKKKKLSILRYIVHYRTSSVLPVVCNGCPDTAPKIKISMPFWSTMKTSHLMAEIFLNTTLTSLHGMTIYQIYYENNKLNQCIASHTNKNRNFFFLSQRNFCPQKHTEKLVELWMMKICVYKGKLLYDYWLYVHNMGIITLVMYTHTTMTTAELLLFSVKHMLSLRQATLFWKTAANNKENSNTRVFIMDIIIEFYRRNMQGVAFENIKKKKTKKKNYAFVALNENRKKKLNFTPGGFESLSVAYLLQLFMTKETISNSFRVIENSLYVYYPVRHSHTIIPDYWLFIFSNWVSFTVFTLWTLGKNYFFNFVWVVLHFGSRSIWVEWHWYDQNIIALSLCTDT